MIVLGIDPGIARVGWGVIESENRNDPTVIAYDCFETKKDLEEENRLLLIYKEMELLIKKHKPDALAVEKLFFTTNQKTAFIVGQARGVIVLSGVKNKIPVFSYTPLQIKLAITGYGKAEKQQIQKMVQVVLKLQQIPKPDDTADALAVALTHCFTNQNV